MIRDDQAGSAVPDLDLDTVWHHYMDTITQEWPPYTRQLLEHCRALRADNARLRAALAGWDKFAGYCVEHKVVLPVWEYELFYAARDATRAALAAPAVTTTTEGAQ